MQNLLSWIQNHPEISSITMVISLLVLLGTIFLSPYLAALIPEDYFSSARKRTLHPTSSFRGALRKILKNLFGLLLLFLGLIMLVTPGQGLLTIFVALMALDYPGKYRLERWMFAKPAIRRGINWLRDKADAPPITSETKDD